MNVNWWSRDICVVSCEMEEFVYVSDYYRWIAAESRLLLFRQDMRSE